MIFDLQSHLIAWPFLGMLPDGDFFCYTPGLQTDGITTRLRPDSTNESRAMTARLIDGKALAATTRSRVAEEIAALALQNKPVHLVALLIGDNPAARVYAENQGKSCLAVGIRYTLRELPASVSQEELNQVIVGLNADPVVTGIFLHTPLPGHLDLPETQYAIAIQKDVEGVNPANIGHMFYGHTVIAPCTAVAVVDMLESANVPIRGAEVTIVGASRIAGRPIALLLTARDATVTLCHIHSKDTAAHTRKADIVIVAVGKAGLIGASDIKPGAVVIDVGINRVKVSNSDGTVSEKTVGDCRFEELLPVAGVLTPVPGGVGPMTVAILLKNTLRAAKLVYRLEKAVSA